MKRRLSLGCGVALLTGAAGLLLGYLLAALWTVAGGQAAQLALLIGSSALLVGGGGLVVVWTALTPAATAIGGPAPAGRPAPAGWLMWLAAWTAVLAGGAVLATGPAVVLLPPLHFLAAAIPALAITRRLATRPRLTALAYGGCAAAAAALVIEAAAVLPIGALTYLVVQSSPDGRQALEGLIATLDSAGPVDVAALKPLAAQPVVLVALFGSIGLLGPLVEEAVKVAGVVRRRPRTGAQAWAWGNAVGAGFGMSEAVLLGAMGLTAWPAAMLLRAAATLMHATMTGLAAVGWQQARLRRRRGVLALGAAVGGHSLWNSLVLASVLASIGAGDQPASGILSQALGAGLLLLIGTILFSQLAASVLYSQAQERREEHSMTPREYARAERQAAVARLMDFLRIPSVSTMPEHAADIERAAEWVAGRLKAAGAREVRIHPTPGHPVVYGEWTGVTGAPTVLVYGHYDVQPPDPEEEWESPPFEPTIRDGAVYARGASDDKGQVVIHLEALAAFNATRGGPPVNLKYVIEGEEEIGSPHLEAWLHQHAEMLTADVAVVSDTAMVGRHQPSITYGLRGLAYLEVEVTGPCRDLHSGQFGGAVLNPAHALAQIIAALHDAEGRVTVPGFYDRVRPLDEAERAELARVPFDEAAFRQATGSAGNWGESGYTILERLGARPSLDVNGMWSGWTGTGAKTVLPSKAYAKISMRLVPDQDPTEIARLCGRHIEQLAPEGVSVTWRALHSASPALIDRSRPEVRAASRAYEQVFGRAPVFTREGGTIPVVAQLQQVLGLPTVMMGFGLPDDNLHAPNEKFELDNFGRGIEVVIAFAEALGREVS